jgi:hypothetical protein
MPFRGLAIFVTAHGCTCCVRPGLIPFPAPEISTFVITSVRMYRLKTFAKRIFPRCQALLSGLDVTRVRHDAMGVASWRAGSSLPLRYRNGLSGRERRADKASSTCMTLLSTPSAEGTVSRFICPAALRGALRRPRWTTHMSKVDLAVWRRPARAVCEVLMTKFSCFALVAADMKHVQQVESRSVTCSV